MARIIIPTPLRKFTNNQSSFETQASDIQGAIEDLTTTHSDLAKHLLDDHNQIRSFIRIYLGEEDINVLQKEKTSVSPDATISIIPAIAGG